MRRMVVVVLVLALGGCAHLPPEQRRAEAILALAEACWAYGTALKVLAPQRWAGKLSRATVARVDHLNAATAPLCDADPPGDPEEAAARVGGAVTMLMLAVAAEVG